MSKTSWSGSRPAAAWTTVVILSGYFRDPTKGACSVPSTVNVYVPTAGLPTPVGAGGEVGVGVGAGAGPEAARVVVVAAATRVVTVVELADAAVRAVVAVVLEDAVAPGTAMGGAAVVPVVSEVGTLVVLLGGPATANSPPFRNEGGPLWVIWYPITPAARTVTEATPARTFTRNERPCNTELGPPSSLTASARIAHQQARFEQKTLI